MAEMFASFLSSDGHDVTVISRNPRVVENASAKIVDKLENWSAPDEPLIVMGGGAMLSRDTVLEFLARPASRAVDSEFKELTNFASRANARVLPISIGGSGTPDGSGIFHNRRRFFRGDAAPEGTVRLKGDSTLMSRVFGKSYSFFPDVLFSASAHLPQVPKPTSTARARVGVNVHEKRATSLVDALNNGALSAQFQFIPVVTHSSAFSGHYEWGHSEADRVQYQSVSSFLRELASFDAIVSDKLHVGLVAATFDVPFFSFQPKAKTRALHEELGLAQAVTEEPAGVVAQLASLAAGSAPQTLRDRIKSEGLDEAADGHRKFLLAHA
ncbi:hypothetical protein FBY40_1123 [Microbacterium sp. SLBN-154]|uniref:hypothetical protein n=1 Tax=Microbacterium sp. SLBN-154 TaxID=2768458 RepID=UPI00117352A1|nr:hypothetical protein [Microbacterium sp. SLBN-154]TQK18634.1 hypothetical protein FBY40_1123 [Microbacterium sp. SLBN-154]